MQSFVLKGNICHAETPQRIGVYPDHYVVCVDGACAGVFPALPREFSHLPLRDYGDALIIPGLVDLHIHAPQYTFRGTGMDMELMDWLQSQAFPEEMRFSDVSYAEHAYEIFAEQMKKSATTRAVVFGTRHTDATEILMDKLEKTGICCYVGKVNMDQNAPEALCEPSAEASARETLRWLSDVVGKFARTKPILTPRFIPSCSRELLEHLQRIRAEYELPVQSHLSENPEEIRFVHELFPQEPTYGHCYARYGLMNEKTVMAHCVYSTDRERELLKKTGAFIAHCPTSNTDLSSGIAPIRQYLDAGLHVGLGSDVAGGHTESLFRAMTDAIEVSKLYWRLVDGNSRALCFEEAFYLATRGGGAFFGKVGAFEAGFSFDALVLREDDMPHWSSFTPRQRLERFAYLEHGNASLQAKFAAGKQIF